MKEACTTTRKQRVLKKDRKSRVENEEPILADSQAVGDETPDDANEADLEYEKEYLTTYFKVKVPQRLDKIAFKHWALERLENNISLFPRGTELTVTDLFGVSAWHHLTKGQKRQISKEFKIAVAQCVIRGIIFLKEESGELKKRNASLLYRIC